MYLRARICLYACLLAGIFLLHSYLNLVRLYEVEVFPFYVLIISVVFISTSLCGLFELCRRKVEPTSQLLLAVFLTSFFLLIMSSSRFNVIVGHDILYEYVVAKNTLETKRWISPEQITTPYFLNTVRFLSCLSVTVLPVTLSEVLGMNMESVFRFVFPAIGALVPIALFIYSYETFNDIKIALLSTLLYALSHHYLFLLSSILRQQVAHLFLILMFYAITRAWRKHRDRRFILLSFFFAFGVVISHYTIANFALVILLGFLVVPIIGKLFHRFRPTFLQQAYETPYRAILPLSVFIFLATAHLAWLLFTAYSTIFSELGTLLVKMVEAMLGQYHLPIDWTTSYFGSTGKGVVVDAWFKLTGILIIAGFFYGLFKWAIDSKKIAFIVCGASIFGAILLCFISPPFSRTIYANRVYSLGFLFFSVFMALILSAIDKHIKGVILMFLLLSLPMNMILPAHEEYILYHPEQDVSPEVAAFYNPRYLYDDAFSKWLSITLPKYGVVYSDNFGESNLILAGARQLEICSSYPQLGRGLQYLILHNRYVEYGIWVGREQDMRPVSSPTKHVAWEELLQDGNILYNNGFYFLLQSKN